LSLPARDGGGVKGAMGEERHSDPIAAIERAKFHGRKLWDVCHVRKCLGRCETNMETTVQRGYVGNQLVSVHRPCVDHHGRMADYLAAHLGGMRMGVNWVMVVIVFAIGFVIARKFPQLAAGYI